MNRSPLFYALNRGADSDAGGAADLQTDVMRFMAIISLCLVAIFALVQSIPLAPAPQDAEPEKSIPAPPIAASAPGPIATPSSKKKTQPVAEQAVEIRLTRPAPARMLARNEPIALQRPKPTPKPQPASTPARDTQEATVAETRQSPDGFTLSFETDDALTRLVARQVVGLYAISPETSQRMNISGGEISFWPASVPVKYHEMDQSTVPDEVIATYRKSNDISGVKWGVTLPADMSRELNAYLSNEKSGSLVIAGNGRIDLRH
jgi:hypothetical protein